MKNILICKGISDEEIGFIYYVFEDFWNSNHCLDDRFTKEAKIFEKSIEKLGFYHSSESVLEYDITKYSPDKAIEVILKAIPLAKCNDDFQEFIDKLTNSYL